MFVRPYSRFFACRISLSSVLPLPLSLLMFCSRNKALLPFGRRSRGAEDMHCCSSVLEERRCAWRKRRRCLERVRPGRGPAACLRSSSCGCAFLMLLLFICFFHGGRESRRCKLMLPEMEHKRPCPDLLHLCVELPEDSKNFYRANFWFLTAAAPSDSRPHKG